MTKIEKIVLLLDYLGCDVEALVPCGSDTGKYRQWKFNGALVYAVEESEKDLDPNYKWLESDYKDGYFIYVRQAN